jgi:CO/xanthine dehydrogenase Mo-binding subunit/aerobic-type carbon monoxide dehydrogenase small subunit (CoxS/CutS family)
LPIGYSLLKRSLVEAIRGKQPILLKVNSSHREVTVSPSRTLLDVLRNDLGLTGAKRCCDDGECGSCIVLLGGKGVMSCLLPVSQINGKEIVTIEGLAPMWSREVGAECLHPLQYAFMEMGACQCGICIPGMIMEATALLRNNPSPTREYVRKRLSRNLCRCTGYVKIIDAVLYAAEIMQGRRRRPVEFHGPQLVGKSIPRIDELGKVTGQSKYAADLTMEGMLYGKILRSPHHHARILFIDTSEAERLPGVEAVITAHDLEGKPGMPNARPQGYLLAKGTVRFMGEAVAAVAAASQEIVQDALKRIRVAYEPLSAVFDPFIAAQDDAPKLHPPYSNKVKMVEVVQGDFKKGFSQADVIVENVYTSSRPEHAALESEAGLAYLEDNGQVVIRTPLHHPFVGRDCIADWLGVPKAKVRIICPTMGGNFGMRGDFVNAGILALLAWKTKRPVKIEFTREESLIGSSKGYSFYLTYKTGATKDGRLTATDIEIMGNAGAWPFDPDNPNLGRGIISVTGIFAPGPYYIPNLRITVYDVCTNGPRSVPIRGTNNPELAHAWDSQMDLLAAKIVMDPLEFRLRNVIEPGTPIHSGEVLDESVGARATLAALRQPYAEALAWRDSGNPASPWKRGIGLGCAWQTVGGERRAGAGGDWHGRNLGHATAAVELLEDGRVRVFVGCVEKGQGLTTALAQMAAEELGVDVTALDVVSGDTFLAPYPVATSGQRTTFHVGGALVKASQSLKQALKSAAAEILEESARNIVLESGHAFSSRFAREKVPFQRLALYFKETGLRSKHEGTFVLEKSEKGRGPIYGYSSQLSLIEVNINTGHVRIPKVAYAADVGKVLNPLILEGQVEGGIAMGSGRALKEQFVAGKTRTLKDYGLPTIMDVPDEMSVIFIEDPVFGGPFGSKGAAEMCVIPGPPSIINAIADATGARIYDLPATPEKILRALERSSV